MRKIILPVALAWAALSLHSSAQAQDHVRISGLAYFDYSYTLGSPDSEEEGENGFGYRRLYLTTDFRISEDFSARARLEGSDSSTNSDGKPAPFVKDLFLRWRNSFAEGQDLFLGISSPPSFTVSESVWGYRSLEKTIQDRVGVVSSRDFGLAVRGRLNEDGTVRYGVMVANNSGTKAETDKDKRVYGQVELYPSDNLVFTLGGDYASLSDEDEDNSVNANALAAYRAEAVSVGAEGFFNRVALSGVDDENDTYGVSLFARTNINDNVTLIGRFDRVEFTGPGVEASENYFIAGVAVRPHENVEFIPNVWVSKMDSDDSAFVSGRLTAHVRF
ncbi:MAG: hypothetical protein R3178_06610 [Rhodothermales bacterium]|nr:hypothetical protein [Rhodothermales bacterium]